MDEPEFPGAVGDQHPAHFVDGDAGRVRRAGDRGDFVGSVDVALRRDRGDPGTGDRQPQDVAAAVGRDARGGRGQAIPVSGTPALTLVSIQDADRTRSAVLAIRTRPLSSAIAQNEAERQATPFIPASPCLRTSHEVDAGLVEVEKLPLPSCPATQSDAVGQAMAWTPKLGLSAAVKAPPNEVA